MFQDFAVGQFIPGKSIIHKLDPRTKIFGVCVLVILVFLGQSWLTVLGMLCIAGVLAGLTGITVKLYLSSVKALWPVYLLTILINSVAIPAESGINLMKWSLTPEGFGVGVMMAVRLALAVVITAMFTFTTSPIVLTDGLERLFKPLTKLGFPGHEIALMMTIAIRFIPTIMEEGDRLVKAIQARGGDLGGGWIGKRARSLVPLLIPLFVGAFRRADDLAMAMEVRCYRGGEGRTRFKELALSPRDYAAMAALLGLLLIGVGATVLPFKI